MEAPQVLVVTNKKSKLAQKPQGAYKKERNDSCEDVKICYLVEEFQRPRNIASYVAHRERKQSCRCSTVPCMNQELFTILDQWIEDGKGKPRAY